MNWAVYRYDYPDGSAYVGSTSRLVSLRHHLHRSVPVNVYLWWQMQQWPDVRPAVVSRHRTQPEAEAAEKQLIAELERPLNKWHIAAPRYEPDGYDPDKVTQRVRDRLVHGGRTREAERIRTRNRRNYPRSDRPQKCRICYETKPAAEFNTGRRRSCGLDSKCRACGNVIRGYMRTYAYAGINSGRAYRAAIEDIRGERQ